MGDDLAHLQSELSLTERRGTTRGQLVGPEAKLQALRLGLPAVERREIEGREGEASLDTVSCSQHYGGVTAQQGSTAASPTIVAPQHGDVPGQLIQSRHLPAHHVDTH